MKLVYQLKVNGEDKGFFPTPEEAWDAIPDNAEYEILEMPVDTGGAYEEWRKFMQECEEEY